MLTRKRRQQVPTFLEGTPGRYFKRDMPPKMPSYDGFQQNAPVDSDSWAQSTQSLDHHIKGNLSNKNSRSVVSICRPVTYLPSQNCNGGPSIHPIVTNLGMGVSSSVGNVVQHETNSMSNKSVNQRPTSISLQSLPGRSITSCIANAGLCVDPRDDNLPLPANWGIELTQDGIRYYVDHKRKRTHWIHPLARETLPRGWIKRYDEVNGVVYVNETERRCQFYHPGFTTPLGTSHHCPEKHCICRKIFINYVPSIGNYLEEWRHIDGNRKESVITPLKAESTIENLNIISEDTPSWLRLYSSAPTKFDHILSWELFSISQLEDFDMHLRKLFKQEVIDTVIRYERLRREIYRELFRRQLDDDSSSIIV